MKTQSEILKELFSDISAPKTTVGEVVGMIMHLNPTEGEKKVIIECLNRIK